VLGQPEVGAFVCHGLAAPQLPPDDHVLFQVLAAAFVNASARFPFADDLGQAPASAESEHEAALRHLVEARERVGKHRRLPERRQQNCGAEPRTLRDRRAVRERRERLDTRLRDDAVAHPDVHAGFVARARDAPHIVESRPARRLDDDRAVRQENA
jgi:hypothetical protein